MKKKQLMEEKVFAYMREHHMLEPGDRVVAGISGGADSVCLLFVLLEWAKRVPLQLAVVHVNHGIRPEAVEDAGYVEKLCKEYELPFYLIEEDVPQKAAMDKCSEEEAGRKVRYEAFARIAQEFNANKIAVAHNSNDRSETMLFHLFRGSGIKGLGSIQPVRENIIRPILCLERAEIESYLQEQGISYCQDATNNTDDYTRNRIRHHILPYVEEEIVQGCVRHMAQTAEMLSETEDYLEQQTAAAMKQCVEIITDVSNPFVQVEASEQLAQKKMTDMSENVRVSAYRISVQSLLQYHPVIQKRVLHTLVKTLSPGHKDISYVHIRDLLGLFREEGNRTVCLPFGIRGRREYDMTVIEYMTESAIEKVENSTFVRVIPIELSGEKKVWKDSDCMQEVSLGDGMTMQFSIFQQEELFPEIPQNEYTKWFDYDKIKGCPMVRCRQTGDYLTITDGKGNMIHKSLKDYMIAQKISRSQRDRILLLAEGKHVIWLPGYRISEYYKISENTKRVLQVQLISKEFTEGETEENNGRTC